MSLPPNIHALVASRLEVKDVLAMQNTAQQFRKHCKLSAVHETELMKKLRDDLLFRDPSQREDAFDRLLAGAQGQSEQVFGPMLGQLAQRVGILPKDAHEPKMHAVLAAAQRLPESHRLAVLKHVADEAILLYPLVRKAIFKSLMVAGEALSEPLRIPLLERIIEKCADNAHAAVRDMVLRDVASAIEMVNERHRHKLFDALAVQVVARCQTWSANLDNFRSCIQAVLALPHLYRGPAWAGIEAQIPHLPTPLQENAASLLSDARKVR